MSTKFHPLQVKEVRKETHDCVSVSLVVPDALKETFRYKQGQYITLRTHVNGEEVRRSYSLCSSPLDDEWRVAIKKVKGGLFSTFANQTLKAGDVLEVMPPNGRFYHELDATQARQYVAFAAGSGITPVLSIISTTLRTEPHSTFTLVYGNRDRNSIIFKEALEALKNKFMQRFSLYHVLSREKTDAPLNQGRIDADKCEHLFSKLIDIRTVDAFFICGPEQMILTVKDLLESKQVDRHKVHAELFSSPRKMDAMHQVAQEQHDSGPKSRITLKVDGVESSFDLAYGGEAILDAALKQGADLPYACKGGVCCTCKGKLLEGEVSMDVNWGLEPEEIEAGYILTCQSHPKTSVVRIDMDSR